MDNKNREKAADVTQDRSKEPAEARSGGPNDGARRKPANQTDPAKGTVPQRSKHEPKGKDLPRGSEPETRSASSNRT